MEDEVVTSDIIDNQTQSLSDAIKGKLMGTKSASFAVGYLFVSGLIHIFNELKEASKREGFELRLLIGNTTDRDTIETLAAIYCDEDYLRNVVAKKIKLTGREERKKRIQDTEQKIEENVSLMPQERPYEELIHLLSILIKQEKMKIRIYNRGRLHSKAYIFNYLPEQVRITNEKGASFVGSSNLSLSGISGNTGLNVQVHGNENHKALHQWFNRLWNDADPFDENLMRVLEKSWAMNIVSPFDLYYRTLGEIVKKFESDEIEGPFLRLARRTIKPIFEESGIDPTKDIYDPVTGAPLQIPHSLPDRKALDDIVFNTIGLTQEERDEVYRAVCQLVKNRLEKARSV